MPHPELNHPVLGTEAETEKKAGWTGWRQAQPFLLTPWRLVSRTVLVAQGKWGGRGRPHCFVITVTCTMASMHQKNTRLSRVLHLHFSNPLLDTEVEVSSLFIECEAEESCK